MCSKILVLMFSFLTVDAFSQTTCTHPTHTTCRVNTGTTSTITGAGGQCRTVNNTSGVDRMVAINTANEWSAAAPTPSFLAYPSPSMAINTCIDVTPNAISMPNQTACDWQCKGSGGITISGINTAINIRIRVTSTSGWDYVYKNGTLVAESGCGYCGVDTTISMSSGDSFSILSCPAGYCGGHQWEIRNTSDGNALLAAPYYNTNSM